MTIGRTNERGWRGMPEDRGREAKVGKGKREGRIRNKFV